VNNVVIVIGNANETLNLTELCEACHISSDYIYDLIKHGIIQPRTSASEWIFNLSEVRRIKTVLRLQRDLEVNLPSAALILDMLEELNELRTRVAMCDRYHL